MYENANLTIVTNSGITVILQILLNETKIMEVIRPPDYRMFETSAILAKTTQFAPCEKNDY